MSISNLFKRKKKWKHQASEMPWFDRPDALELLERRRVREKLSDADFRMLQKWAEEGCCTVSGVIPEKQIDAMVADMEDIWTAAQPIEGLEILDLRLNQTGASQNLSHAELLALDVEQRLSMRANSNWRIHGFYQYSANAATIFNNPELIRLASLILAQPAAPNFTINFTYGSEQALHQDTAVFHVKPRNYVVGAWLACEDIATDSGPLVYYPGSHREPLYPKFDNYPQTNLRTALKPEEYSAYVATRSERYERKLYFAKKGDIFLWHGMLIHGGSEIANRQLTRRSYVCHYIPPGMEVSAEVEGPFNW